MQTPISATRYVIDASIAINWYLDDEEHIDEARAILAAYVVNEIAFLAPDHIRYEVPNAILVSTRRRRLDLPTAKLAVLNFLATRIATAGDYTLLTSAYDYATRYDCAFYDALYLALADQFECPFVQADRRLRNTLSAASRANCGLRTMRQANPRSSLSRPAEYLTCALEPRQRD